MAADILPRPGEGDEDPAYPRADVNARQLWPARAGQGVIRSNTGGRQPPAPLDSQSSVEILNLNHVRSSSTVTVFSNGLYVTRKIKPVTVPVADEVPPPEPDPPPAALPLEELPFALLD